MKYDFYITGTIGVAYDWWSGQRGTTAQDVKEFLDRNKNKELNIAVSSPGGYLAEGITIGELIASHGNCNMIIVGMTASAATLLCMKAKSVKIAKGSMMLIHNSSIVMSIWRSANKQALDEIVEKCRKQRDELDTFDKAAASIYSARNGKTIEENMAKMDEEKWMLAEDAVSFGIADAILEDEEAEAQASSVRNSCAMMNGLTEHYGLPGLPMEDSKNRGFLARMKEQLSSMLGVMNNVDGEHAFDNKPQKTNTEMKKIILNLVCAALAIQELVFNDKDETSLTMAQATALEDALKKAHDDAEDLNAKLRESQEALASKEKELSEVKDEFEKFKAEAGDDTSSHADGQKKEPVTTASMYNSIKDLI